jgi:hypothetical protein
VDGLGTHSPKAFERVVENAIRHFTFSSMSHAVVRGLRSGAYGSRETLSVADLTEQGAFEVRVRAAG